MSHNTQMQLLIKEFPEISKDKAAEIDSKLKDKISSQTNSNLLDKLAEELVQEIQPLIASRNRKKIKKKCKAVLEFYINNEHQYVLQENWFCLLAYLISLVVMIVRVINVSVECNDMLSWGMYFGALLIWLVLVKIKYAMSDNAKLLLDSFNRCAPSMTIIGSLLFYTAICLKTVPTWGLITIVLASLVITGCLTLHKYKSVKKNVP